MLLLHGYPETKRIWWRNIAALAEAGYEVIAPDLRGYGDSDLSAQDVYDIAYDVLNHRLVLSFDAVADGVTVDDVLVEVLTTVVAPRLSSSQLAGQSSLAG